jgi:hypothetical protein
MFTRHSDAVREAAKRLAASPSKYKGYNIERHVADVSGRPIAVGYSLTMIVRRKHG